jgi:ABC-type transporter Mla subunit MlaD
MSFADRIGSLMGGPAGRALEGSIREIVQQVLREQEDSTGDALRELRSAAREARARVQGLETRLTQLEGQLAAAHASLEQLREALRAAEERASQPAAAAPPPVTATSTFAAEGPAGAQAQAGCQVKGCAQPVRSKGYCSAHYQQWRRGTLRT